MTSLSRFLNRHQSVLAMALLVVVAIIVTIPLFSVGWLESHDDVRYLALHEQFKEAFWHGVPYPRWMPSLYGGYGYPTFVFYQPGYFFLTLFLDMLVPDTLLALQLAVVVMFFIGGSGMFLLTMERTKDGITAGFCALLFMLTPYLFVNVYVRGDFSEFLAIVLTPWPLYFVSRLYRASMEGRSVGPWLGLTAAALAGIVLAHPFTAMFFYPVFCVMALCWADLGAWGRDRISVRTRLMLAAAAVVLAVVLSAIYWLPAFQLKQYVQYQSAIDLPYNWISTHVVYPHQLFARSWDFGASVKGPGDTMSFQLGLPHFLLSLAGLILAVLRRRRIFLLYGAVYAGLIFMTNAASLPIWDHVPYLRYVQFPWRILSVIVVIQCLCASGIGELKERMGSLGYAGGLIAVLMVVAWWHHEQFQVIRHQDADRLRDLIKKYSQARMSQFFTYANTNEFLPVTAQYKIPETRRHRPLITVDHPDCAIQEMPDNNPFRIHFQIEAEKPLLVAINQLYFPGWCVLVNGKRLPDQILRHDVLPDGRMALTLEPGGYRLVAWYDGPPGWPWRNALIILSLFGYLYFVRHEMRQGCKTLAGKQDHVTERVRDSDRSA